MFLYVIKEATRATVAKLILTDMVSLIAFHPAPGYAYHAIWGLFVFLFQVSNHLKEVAKGTNTRVVPIVGGMSTEKQERLLQERPEIVVGTPGRLWELMSGGEIHLIEVSADACYIGMY